MRKKSKCHASGTRLVRVRVNAVAENELKSLVDVEVPDDASMQEVEQAIEAAAVDPDVSENINWDWEDRGSNAFDAFAGVVCEHSKDKDVATPDVTLVRDKSGMLVVKAN